VPSARKLYRTVGNAVRAQRKRAGLSQEHLAEKAGLTRNYIGEVERGEKRVTLDTLAKIARTLKTRVAELTQDI